MCARSSCSTRRSFERTTLVARVLAYFAPVVPSARPSFAVRCTLPSGTESSFCAISRPERTLAAATLPPVMAQDRPTLTVEERSERGSRAARRLRRSGYVPGVVYGGGGEPQAFQVGARELRAALHTSSAVLDLELGGAKSIPVIVKDQQSHPVRGEVLHVDMLQVNLNEKIQTPVTVELVGA